MRSNEQFKTYVYEKAAVLSGEQRKNRRAWLRGVAAFSLCIVIVGVGVYTGLFHNGKLTGAPEAEQNLTGRAANGATCEMAKAEAALEVADAGLDDSEDAIFAVEEEKSNATAILYSALTDTSETGTSSTYSVVASQADYFGELENIDFTVHTALIFENCAVASSNVVYTDTGVFVTIALSDDGGTEESTYTVLLEKAQCLGKKITVIYQ